MVTGIDQMNDIEGLFKILDNQKSVLKTKNRNQKKVENLK